MSNWTARPPTTSVRSPTERNIGQAATYFNKSRYLPVHHSTLQALQRYADIRDRLCPNPSAPSFFVSLRRARLDDTAAQATFRRLCRHTGVGAEAPFPPRLHDLRHYADGGVMRPVGLFSLVKAPPVGILSA